VLPPDPILQAEQHGTDHKPAVFMLGRVDAVSDGVR
jgi:hypothetical protein